MTILDNASSIMCLGVLNLLEITLSLYFLLILPLTSRCLTYCLLHLLVSSHFILISPSRFSYGVTGIYVI
jgi:hypothetical protein